MSNSRILYDIRRRARKRLAENITFHHGRDEKRHILYCSLLAENEAPYDPELVKLFPDEKLFFDEEQKTLEAGLIEFLLNEVLGEPE